jgi:(5-formylfuran-3-yl)methyl phosphate synthase
MTGLLISVRDAEEAATALAGGVDLVDIKEPSRGSLGAASDSVWREVLAVCESPKTGLAPGHGCPVPVPFSGRVPTSVALGELLDARADWDFELLAHFQFAKLGLAGCGRQADWVERWSNALRSLPPTVASVAVVYADWQQCEAPPPREIIRRAAELSCKAVLFDTYAKAGGNLFSHLPSVELGQLVAEIRDAALLVVLGGSLAGNAIDQACVFEPDYIAVRGAACRGARTGPVDLQLVRRLAEQVRRANS